MTTLVYCNRTKQLAADTRVTFESYHGYCTKILFPKRGVIVATAGDGGSGEWLRHKLAKIDHLHDLYFLADKPKFEDQFSAFVWWNGPYMVDENLYPFPLETDYWRDGTGGDFALAFLSMGMDMAEAMIRAARLDVNSGAPIHVVKCDSSDKKIKVYQDTLPPVPMNEQRHNHHHK